MNIEKVSIGVEDFEAFAERLGLTLSIKERPPRINAPRYYASFKDVYISEEGFRFTANGNGITPWEAVKDYLWNIEGRILVLPDKSKVEVGRFILRPGLEADL